MYIITQIQINNTMKDYKAETFLCGHESIFKYYLGVFFQQAIYPLNLPLSYFYVYYK